MVKQAKKSEFFLGMLEPVDEGGTVLRNVSHCLSSGMPAHCCEKFSRY
jgi:hypothetical protein